MNGSEDRLDVIHHSEPAHTPCVKGAPRPSSPPDTSRSLKMHPFGRRVWFSPNWSGSRRRLSAGSTCELAAVALFPHSSTFRGIWERVVVIFTQSKNTEMEAEQLGRKTRPHQRFSCLGGSICLHGGSETLRICQTSWQSCHFNLIFNPQASAERSDGGADLQRAESCGRAR